MRRIDNKPEGAPVRQCSSAPDWVSGSLGHWGTLLFSFVFFLSSGAFADTIYFKDATTEKGLVVEEYYDRFVVNAGDGEKEILKSNIDEIFFDEPYHNNVYLGKRFEAEGDFERAFQLYQLALQSNPDFKEAQAAIKGLEDAKWVFKKAWTYRELKEILSAQLGISLRQVNGKIIISKIDRGQFSKRELSPLAVGDAIISCWARPVTYAGLKNASRILIGLSNTILELVIERDIRLPASPGLKLFSPITINMEVEGPVVKSIEKNSPPYKAGLREGDLLVKIDGESTRYMKLDAVKRKIFHGSKDKLITLRKELTLMRRRSENGRGLKNAMWVWHSKEILLNEAKRKELLDFCKEKNIALLFFQLQYRFIDRGQFSKRELSPLVLCRLLYDTKLKAFLKDAHSQGIIVYALDGSPEFCLENGHQLVLAQIKAILDFNNKALAQERFDGVHYDNEPYLLPAFNSGLRGEIITQFLSLNRKCRDLIDSSGAKLEFGIDIPFWFDELDSLDRKLIALCDDIGIMDYRNFASSPDGIIAHALNELKYAAGAKKKVYVGLETSKYPNQEVYFVSIINEENLDKASAALDRPRLEGFGLRTYAYEKKIYIGVVKPEGANEEDFKKALAKLEGEFGGVSKPEDKEKLDSLTFDVIYALSTNPEFRDAQSQEYTGKGGGQFLIFRAKEVMLEKLTFADLGEEDLNKTIAEAKKEFENYPSFAGFAFHHYKSYKELCGKK